MKTLLGIATGITLLLSISIFGQSGKSVLTQAQKDSVGVMIKDSLNVLQAMSIFAVISNEGYSTPTIVDQSHRGYVIDSVYAVTKDSSITFNLYNSENPFATELALFTLDKAVTSKTGVYYYPDSNQTIPIGNYFVVQLLGAVGIMDEKLYMKIYYTLL